MAPAATAWLTCLAIAASSASGSAYALQAGDTMEAWASASADEKAKLVTELLKREGRENATRSVMKCLDAASGVPGHADLSIGKLVKACEGDRGEPV